ncbi:MAG: hypothetical protein PVI30_13055 [Myxococcales bacterium]
MGGWWRAGGRRIICALLVGLGGGCTLDSLWGVDAPRPSLQEKDTFQVDPLCRGHIVDDGAVAPVPSYVTLTAKRWRTGLGAEAVPVTVTLGACELDAGDGGAAGPISRCSRDLGRLPQPLIEQFELEARDNQGCRRRSPSRLDCTLSPRGEASFGVISRLREEHLTERGYVPVCVRPLEIPFEEADGGGAQTPVHHLTEVWVIPRAGTATQALATLEVSAPELLVRAETDATCDRLYDCDQARVRSSFQAGFVSRAIPADALRPRDFLPVRRGVALRARLEVIEPPQLERPVPGSAFLSGTDDCDGSARELRLEIPAGLTATPVFYLCAPGSGGTYSVLTVQEETRAALDGGTLDAGAPDATTADGGAEAAQDPDQLVVHASEVTAADLVRGYRATTTGDTLRLETQLCSGERRPTATAEVEVRDPLDIADGDAIVVDCSAGDDDDAGSGSAACAGGEIELHVSGGDSCRLEVEP